MITNKLVFILALLVLAVLASQARAYMVIYDYQSNEHDRFYTGAGRDFIGEGYDWSGVFRKGVNPAVSHGPGWATMISPQYFLTANHVTPVTGATITFYEKEVIDRSAAIPHEYYVDDWSVNFGDLGLRRLTEPLDPSIAYYPILDLRDGNNYDAYLLIDSFFSYGRDDRVGKNQIDEDGLGIKTVNHERDPDKPPINVTTYAMQYDYDQANGLGDDENLLWGNHGGDSGGPSLVAVSSTELALIGIHWYNGPKYEPTKTFSGDSFVPHYIDELHPYVNGGDANKDGIVNDLDATIVAANWGQTSATWEQGDFNDDGLVNGTDADYLANNWQRPTTWLRSSQEMTTPVASASGVPEPTTAILLLIGSLSTAALHFRRRACSR